MFFTKLYFAGLLGLFGMALTDGPRTWNFDDEKAGQAPSGWSFRGTKHGKSVAHWEVRQDNGATSKPNVLSLVKTENRGSTYNVAIIDKTSHKDVDLTMKVRADSGKEDQGGGLIWRVKDENNYYICRINPLENNYRVYKVVGGKRTRLQSAKVKLKSGTWNTLRVVMVGQDIRCYLDDKRLLDAKDDTFQDAGKIGLWTKADAASSFDDLAVKEASAVERLPVEKDDK